MKQLHETFHYYLHFERAFPILEGIMDYSPEMEQCREQLKKILSSEGFRKANRSSSLLEFIVGKTLAKEFDTLKEYTIAVEAFGLETSFDHQLNPKVRVEASRLRARLNDYYESQGVDDPIRIYIPKGSYKAEFQKKNGTVNSPGIQNNKKFNSTGTILFQSRHRMDFELTNNLNGLHAWHGDYALANIQKYLCQHNKPATSGSKSHAALHLKCIVSVFQVGQFIAIYIKIYHGDFLIDVQECKYISTDSLDTQLNSACKSFSENTQSYIINQNGYEHG